MEAGKIEVQLTSTRNKRKTQCTDPTGFKTISSNSKISRKYKTRQI